MNLTLAQLNALPAGSAVRCTTERGMRTVLALKVGGYGREANAWCTTDGAMFPTSFAISQADPVLLEPTRPEGAEEAITTATAPEHMTMWWDATLWLPFVESDDGDITGPGHQDREAFARLVTAYDRHATGDPNATETTEAEVSHDWIIAEANDSGEWAGRRVTSDIEGAIPVTTIWGSR